MPAARRVGAVIVQIPHCRSHCTLRVVLSSRKIRIDARPSQKPNSTESANYGPAADKTALRPQGNSGGASEGAQRKCRRELLGRFTSGIHDTLEAIAVREKSSRPWDDLELAPAPVHIMAICAIPPTGNEASSLDSFPAQHMSTRNEESLDCSFSHC
jgi:hypothetical protein